MTAQPVDPPEYETADPTRLEVAFLHLTGTIADLSEAAPEHLDAHDDNEAAVLLLRDLREARQALQSVEAWVEAATARRLGNGKHKVEGFAVEVRGGNSYKEWRHDDVAWQLTRPIAVDPDTGELNPDVTPIIDAVRSLLLNAARPEWRTTVLRQHGIDPGDYSTRTPYRRTVAITADVDAVVDDG